MSLRFFELPLLLLLLLVAASSTLSHRYDAYYMSRIILHGNSSDMLRPCAEPSLILAGIHFQLHCIINPVSIIRSSLVRWLPQGLRCCANDVEDVIKNARLNVEGMPKMTNVVH